MALTAGSTLAAGAATVLLFSIHSPVWAVVAIATFASGLWIVPWTVLLNAITGASSQSRATGVGLFGISNQTGAVGGSAFGGLLLAAVGFPGVGCLCLGAAVLSVAVIVLFMREAGAGAKLLVDESS